MLDHRVNGREDRLVDGVSVFDQGLHRSGDRVVGRHDHGVDFAQQGLGNLVEVVTVGNRSDLEVHLELFGRLDEDLGFRGCRWV